ncbi:hypothetical protein [Mycobacterium sp.]|uniref:hypothetical protein n=1 Tax=Mycobacterium sp. TaxID=1785 RepID=UPI0025D2E657|nr:hypothetical protein [Mycobacterium sp.]
MTKKLMMIAACVAAVSMGNGIAYADDTTDGPDPNGPKCNVSGGDDGQKWEWAPCGWAYGEERGWYRVP